MKALQALIPFVKRLWELISVWSINNYSPQREVASGGYLWIYSKGNNCFSIYQTGRITEYPQKLTQKTAKGFIS